jgi:hypothetical protein
MWKPDLGARPNIAKIKERMDAGRKKIVVSMPLYQGMIKPGFVVVTWMSTINLTVCRLVLRVTMQNMWSQVGKHMLRKRC